jgi:hypothetical protein
MVMQTENLEAVRKRYEFDAWKGINRLDHELEIRGLAVPAGLIAGLQAERIREIDPGDGTRLLRISWVDPGQDGSLLLMDIRECPSRERAHEVLLELLANMQAPGVKRLGDEAPGDIAFGLNASAAMVFARGNVAISIANGGSETVSVNEIARMVDGWLVEQG